MADHDPGLLAIEVEADDYAETAAGDTPSVSRTYQSESDFQAIKATYTAKQDDKNTYKDLISAVPALKHENGLAVNGSEALNGHEKVKLSKKDSQLLGHAVGEMYYNRQYQEVIGLCERVRGRCEVDEKMVEALQRWERRCRERIGGEDEKAVSST